MEMPSIPVRDTILNSSLSTEMTAPMKIKNGQRALHFVNSVILCFTECLEFVHIFLNCIGRIFQNVACTISVIPRKCQISVDGKVFDKADGSAPRIIVDILGCERVVNGMDTDPASKPTAVVALDGSGDERAEEGTIESDDENEDSKECSLWRRRRQEESL